MWFQAVLQEHKQDSSDCTRTTSENPLVRSRLFVANRVLGRKGWAILISVVVAALIRSPAAIGAVKVKSASGAPAE